MSPRPVRYGAWPSPITAAQLTATEVARSDPSVFGDELAWSERRPAEGGRQVLVAIDRSGSRRDVLPPPFSARTRVHEYGGRCFTRGRGCWLFSNDDDQRIWSITDAGVAEPLTSEPPAPRSVRFADLVLDPSGRFLYAVRERHEPSGVHNDLVRLDLASGNELHVVAAGHDFYAAPRLGPGAQLAYLAWDAPDMPWDATILIVARLGSDGLALEETVVDGGPGISISQPRYAPDGELHYLSDRSGYSVPWARSTGALIEDAADFGGPDWVFGQASYAFSTGGRCYAVRYGPGGQRLGELRAGRFQPIPLPFSAYSGLVADGEGLVALAGSPSTPTALVRITPGTGEYTVLAASQEPRDDLTVSLPEPITFTGGTGEPTHALYYPPASAAYCGEPGTLPPLVVMSHGGPTSQAQATFDLQKQYLTSRGLAIVDVDYGGSSGYGRAYRERLEGRWGVLDVADCVAAARHLADAGLVDAHRLLIRGGSAGGFTTLAALATTDTFAAGASLYGVSDLALLAAETHKFEARYLDRLVGPWPAAAEVYASRSPLTHAREIRCPVIFFQGLEDAVVPPDQAELLVTALRANGVPVCYVTFAGEGHGFRRAASIEFVARAQLSFFGAVLGFVPDEVVALDIENAGELVTRG